MKIEEIINKVHCADSLTFLKEMPSESVDLCITSPPYYGLRNYGVEGQIGLEKTFDEYLEKILLITAEIKRVMKPTATFFLNMGDCFGGVKIGKTDKKCSDYIKEAQIGLKKDLPGFEKCMLMQPERLAIKMIDEQGFILRNKIKWCKQVLLYKERKTKGSVMPTSVKDRFNESGEELYFFVKSKKYYFDLDAVRLPNQVVGITDMRDPGILRQRLYPESKYNKFNYRVRDANRKEGQPQFKASEEELSKYGKGSEYEQKYGEPWDRFGKNTKKYQGKFAGNENADPKFQKKIGRAHV